MQRSDESDTPFRKSLQEEDYFIRWKDNSLISPTYILLAIICNKDEFCLILIFQPRLGNMGNFADFADEWT